MRTKSIVLLLVVIACWCSFPKKEKPAVTAQMHVLEGGARVYPKPFEIYRRMVKYDLQECEHLFSEWQAARAKGDKADEQLLHERIACYTASHEAWRWRFYKYGVDNPSALTPQEKEAWKMVVILLEGRKQKLTVDDYLKIDPRQIRAQYVEERKAFGFQDAAPVSAPSPTNLQ